MNSGDLVKVLIKILEQASANGEKYTGRTENLLTITIDLATDVSDSLWQPAPTIEKEALDRALALHNIIEW